MRGEWNERLYRNFMEKEESMRGEWNEKLYKNFMEKEESMS